MRSGCVARLGDRADRQGAGVRGENGGGRRHRIQSSDHAPLGVDVLDDRLDDQIDIGQVGKVLSFNQSRKPGVDPGLGLGLGEVQFPRPAAQPVRDPCPAAFRRSRLGVMETYLPSRLEGHLGNSSAHRPGADHRKVPW